MAVLTTIKTYALDGTTKDFQVPFEYLSRQFVIVTLFSNDGTRKQLALTTDYTWTSNTNIRTSQVWDDSIYQYIEIRRQTSATDRIVTFQDGSILRADDLNKSEIQALHIAEEARDASYTSLQQNTDGNLDALNRRIVNVAPAVDGTDAVNKDDLDAYAVSAQGFVTNAGNSASAAATSASNASGYADTAKTYRDNASTSAGKALTSEQHAKTSETNAGTSETNAGNSATSSQTYAGQSMGYRDEAQGYANTAKTHRDNAETFKNNASSSASAASGSAVTAKNEADRAKSEADKIAGQNELTNAITGVGAAPDYKVDFKTMPSVNGVDIVQQLTTGGFQVNSDLICKADATGGSLNDIKFAGKNFMCEKADTIVGDVTSNKAPALMEYDQALVCDVYGIWTPSGLNEGKTRVQTMFDKNVTWVRGYHLQDDTWTPWKRVPTQFFTNISGMDANTLQDSGSYFYMKDTSTVITSNVPVITGNEASDVYFLEVNSAKEGADVMQTVHSPKTNSRFDRYMVNGTWSRWWNSTATFDVDTAPASLDIDKTVNPGLWNFNVQTMINRPSFIGSVDQGTLIVEIIGAATGLCLQKAYRASPLANKSSIWTRWCSNPEVVNQTTPQTPTWSGWTNLIQQDTNGIINATKISMPSNYVPALDGDVTTKSYVDGKLATVGGGSLGDIQWFINRTFLPAGFVAADGQLLDRVSYPGMSKMVTDGEVPVTSDATWLASPANRGVYTPGPVTPGTQFRLPDLNGFQSGSITAPFLRGDSGGGNKLNNPFMNGQVMRGGAPEIVGTFATAYNSGPTGVKIIEGQTGAFAGIANGSNVTKIFNPIAAGTTGTGNAAVTPTIASNVSSTSFAASRSNTAYGNGLQEVRPNSVVGCWAIRCANGTPVVLGAADANSISTRVEAIKQEVDGKLDSWSDWKNWNDQSLTPYFDFGTVLPAMTANGLQILWDGNNFHMKGIIRKVLTNTTGTGQLAAKTIFGLKAFPNGKTKCQSVFTPCSLGERHAGATAGGATVAGKTLPLLSYVEEVSASGGIPANMGVSLTFSANTGGLVANPAPTGQTTEHIEWVMVDLLIQSKD